MKFGVPWSVKGIRPEARESAREAARRSGQSLGEWLNNVILEQAADRAPGHEHDDEDDYADELAGVHDRLDDLTRRISQFSRAAPKAPPRSRGRSRDVRAEEPDRLAELIGRLDHRIEQLVHVSARAQMLPPAPPMPPAPQHVPHHHIPAQQHIPHHMAPPVAPYAPHPAVAAYAPPMHRPQAYAPQPPQQPAQRPAELDRALAEIAARQRMLNGQPPLPAAAPAAAPAPQAAPAPVFQQVPTQDLSGLEDQLRRITDQIETLRKPGVEEAINALRDELGDIGRALNDAMPRRAIDTIEKQIQGLTQRIAEGRQAGADQHAVAGLEHGLAEVRDALRGLTPAENLIGFNDAVSGLAHKIDLIVAQKDPATLQQLEHAITTLRDMAAHVASNDAVGELAAQVHALGQKVEELGRTGGAGDVLNHLEQRIDALSHALAERAQNGASVPPRLEALVQSLSDKIELIQESRSENPAVGHLEDRIVHLVQRLDASDSRLGHLEAIERGLGDLLMQIDEMRASKQADSLRVEAESAVGVDSLKVDLARTQNVLENVNGTLSAVVDRLARIESDIRDEGRRRAAEPEPLELTQPMGRVVARAVPEMAPPQPAPQHLPPAAPLELQTPAPAPMAAAPQPAAPQAQPQPQVQEPPRRMPQARVSPIDPDLPPDQPLEPGSGPPRQRVGARIAVGAAQPAPAGAASNLIAAARRAAQTAVKSAPRPVRADAAEEPIAGEAPRGLMKRMKSLFVAASIVGIAIGTVQVGGKFLIGDKPAQPLKTAAQAPAAQAPQPLAAASDANDDDDDTNVASAAPASPLAPALSAPSSIITNPTPMIPNMPSPLAAPALSTAPAQKSDVTGSIPSSARTASPAAERLPTEIGGPKLRNAALGGDAAAAYEIASRYAEGRGVPTNAEEAARWYERAAGKGVAMAQFRYAAMLEKGRGVKKDLGQARRLYLAAASKGNAKAMHNLAVLYAEGIEGRPDYTTAAQWFRKAAEHGVADSQYNLGVLAARGLGTPKSMSDAYKWFALAAAQGDKEAARKRDDVATQLDGAALADAQAAVKKFTALAQPQEAIAVAIPSGGWDDAAPATQAPHRARSGGPLALGPYKVGKR